MTAAEEICQYLLDKYGVIYNGLLEVKNEDNAFELVWDLNRHDKPFVIIGEFDSEKDFIKFVKKEIDERRLYVMEAFVMKNININNGSYGHQ